MAKAAPVAKTCPVCVAPIPEWADQCSMACQTIAELRRTHGRDSYGELLTRHLLKADGYRAVRVTVEEKRDE